MEKRFQLLLVITITLLLSCWGEQRTETYDGRVAIMYAFDAEGQLLRSQMAF